MDRELQDDNRRGHFDSYIDHFDEADRVVLRVTDHRGQRGPNRILR
jgi:hypothetical protein